MPKTALLIYDAQCPVCARGVDWLRQQIPPETLEYAPCGGEAHLERHPEISGEACMRAVHLVMPGGRVYAGADALPPLLRMTRRGRPLARLTALPGVLPALRLFYAWFAPRRLRVSALLGMTLPERGCNASCQDHNNSG
jgi:predicted DCC family thiol-disulfide oxidoreductase YuxK